MKVLMSPAHVTLDASFGSEISWATTMIDRMSKNHPVDITAICGELKSGTHFNSNVRIEEIGFTKWASMNRFMFYTWCYQRSKDLVSQMDVIHHILPFGYGVGFNFLPMLKATEGRPFVLGPVQSPPIGVGFGDYAQFTGRSGLYGHLAYRGERMLNLSFGQIISNLNRRTVRNADAIGFVSSKTRDLYRSRYPEVFDEAITEVIPSGVEIESFPYSEPEDHKIKRIVCAGGLTEKKGVQFLIEALPQVLKQAPETRLVVVGSGQYRPHLEHRAIDLGIRDRVDFIGTVPRENMPAIYAASDVYVQPSIYGGLSSSMEAMSSGRPVIATDIDFYGEYLPEGQGCFLVPPRDVGALSDRLVRLLTEDNLRYKMGRAARKHAETFFDWNISVARWYALYQSVV